jgi:predicted ATPase
MQILAFRVKNFRSILDSKWIRLSQDGITVFVGQNESGKSSLLVALACALSHQSPSSDDFRVSDGNPTVELRIKTSINELSEEITDLAFPEREAIRAYLNEEQGLVELAISWQHIGENQDKIERLISMSAPKLEKKITMMRSIATAGEMLLEAIKPALPEEAKSQQSPAEVRDSVLATINEVANLIWWVLPLGVFFSENDGELPSIVDINDEGEPFGDGAQAAENYLRIAGIDLAKLIKKDRRGREYELNKANDKLNEDFNRFWSQTIGKTGRLALKCEIDHYDVRNPQKVGKPHLAFWISDGHTHLYPRQRSHGVRWFISFYLQLKASEIDKLERVFLLDEPGANLHMRAQNDVLRLINALNRENSTVIYSTHSPQLLEYPKLYRVHAVQRNSDLDDSPSIVIGAHELGTASSDTLSPVLTAMGSDLSHHKVIRRENNVLLEEMSGYYYLSAFWRLTDKKTEAHFIAATGVNKIEPLANLFIGWGLDFIIAIDDDSQGREAGRSMRRNLFGGDDAIADRKLLRFRGCLGIEDVFSPTDFCRFILKSPGEIISNRNSEHVKNKGISKPILAYQFALAVSRGELHFHDLDEVSRDKISAITTQIETLLLENAAERA